MTRIGQGGEFEPRGTDIHQQIAVMNVGFDLGLTLIDTAEIYGNGYSEEIIGQAINDKRARIFLASKFSPQNALNLKGCHKQFKKSSQIIFC